jgi:hypothetical protein
MLRASSISTALQRVADGAAGGGASLRYLHAIMYEYRFINDKRLDRDSEWVGLDDLQMLKNASSSGFEVDYTEPVAKLNRSRVFDMKMHLCCFARASAVNSMGAINHHGVRRLAKRRLSINTILFVGLDCGNCLLCDVELLLLPTHAQLLAFRKRDYCTLQQQNGLHTCNFAWQPNQVFTALGLLEYEL